MEGMRALEFLGGQLGMELVLGTCERWNYFEVERLAERGGRRLLEG